MVQIVSLLGFLTIWKIMATMLDWDLQVGHILLNLNLSLSKRNSFNDFKISLDFDGFVQLNLGLWATNDNLGPIHKKELAFVKTDFQLIIFELMQQLQQQHQTATTTATTKCFWEIAYA